MADGAIIHNCNPDSGLAEAASLAVAAFVSDWAARGHGAAKALDAVSAAVVEVRRRNPAPAGNEGLARRLDALVEGGGLPSPEPEDDLLGGTDLDLPEGGT
jgi:hypothetical protein